MLCIVVKGPTWEEAYDQINKAAPIAEIIEIRLDYFPSLDPKTMGEFRQSCKVPVIFTLRALRQGGNYQGEESARLAHILQLAVLEPDYFDFEFDVPREFVHTFREQYPKTKIILSYHDFTMTPASLHDILIKMKQTPADIYKIATMSHSSIDALQTLEFLKMSKDPLAAISMGEAGQATRILGKIFDNKMTYASLESSLETAPGQLSAKTLIECYHYKSLNPATKIYGLIGDPVDRSISHYTHNALINSEKLDAVYIKMNVKKEELGKFLALAQRIGIKGLSVTMPLKEVILPFLDEIDPIAKKIGAVNTLVINDSGICGYNTDGIGALEAIEEQVPVAGKRMIILGAGGSAKAIAYVALQRNAEVLILNRDEQKAKQLAKQLGCQGGKLSDLRNEQQRSYEVVVNCTPLPLPVDIEDLNAHAYAMDINTIPKYSPFLAKAREKGMPVIFGYKMFVNQAVEQFKLWYNGSISSEIKGKLEEFTTQIL